MGNLEHSTLREVWHGKSYQDLRHLHASGRWYEHPVCRNCEIPLIELYKALEKRAESPPTDPLPVASEMAPKDGTAVDLVQQFENIK